MDYARTAEKILERVGGKDNVLGLVHCMTRLRFTLKDESIVDDDLVKRTKGVMGVIRKAGQYQVIIGNDVAYVYEELCKLGNFKGQPAPQKANNAPKKKQSIPAMLMDTISGIMSPVIPAIIGAAMIKVLLTLLPMIGWLNTEGQTYQILSVIGDGAFYFMPVLIAISAARKFNTNTYYAASLALIMLHPNFVSLMSAANEAEQTVKFLGVIPVTYANYAYSVIPIILSVWMLKYVEKLVDKITPVITKNFLKPMLVVLIAAPIALIVLGPLGAICGEWLSKIVYFAHDKLGFIAVGIVAGVFPFVVMAGMHHAFTPIKLGMIATGGYEAFICIAELCSNMAQGAAALAVAVKTKNKDFKQVAGSSAFSALVAGITEPALYGVTVRLKKPMLGACIGAVAGGLFGGFMQMKCYGIATPAIVTIVQYAEPGNAMSLVIAALTILITVVVTFIATMIIGFEDIVDEDDDDMPSPEPAKIVEPKSKFDKVVSPVEGTAVKSEILKNQEQSEFSKNFDMVMSPDKETVYAPFEGKVLKVSQDGKVIEMEKAGSGLKVTLNVFGSKNAFEIKKKPGDNMSAGEEIGKINTNDLKNALVGISVQEKEKYMDVVPSQKDIFSRQDVLVTVV